MGVRSACVYFFFSPSLRQFQNRTFADTDKKPILGGIGVLHQDEERCRAVGGSMVSCLNRENQKVSLRSYVISYILLSLPELACVF